MLRGGKKRCTDSEEENETTTGKGVTMTIQSLFASTFDWVSKQNPVAFGVYVVIAAIVLTAVMYFVVLLLWRLIRRAIHFETIPHNGRQEHPFLVQAHAARGRVRAERIEQRSYTGIQQVAVAIAIAACSIALLIVIARLVGEITLPLFENVGYKYIPTMGALVAGLMAVAICTGGVVALLSRTGVRRVRLFFHGVGYFFGTDNRRWFTLFVMTLFVSIMAWTHPGQPLIKPAMDAFRSSSQLTEIQELKERYHNLSTEGEFLLNREFCGVGRDVDADFQVRHPGNL